MIRLPAALWLLFAMPLYGLAQPPAPDTLWTREYWDVFEGGASTIISTQDGGTAICGAVFYPDNASIQFGYARKLDWLGNIEWTHLFESGRPLFSEVIELSDQSLIFCGGGAWGDYPDPYLVRISHDGEILGRHQVEVGSEVWGANLIAPGRDGSFAIAGQWHRSAAGSIDPYLMTLNGEGHVQTMHSFECGFLARTDVYDLVPCQAGGWLLVGNRIDLRERTGGGWLLRLTETGDTLWTRTFPSIGLYLVNSLPSGEIVACGHSQSELVYLRLDPEGHELYRRYPLPGDTNYVIAGGRGFDDGRMVLAMVDYSDWEPQRSVLLLTDAEGNRQWRIGWGHWPFWAVSSCDVAGTPETGFVWLNTIMVLDPSLDRQYIIRLEGEQPVASPVAKVFSAPICSPNPLRTSTMLQFDVYQPAAFRLELYDVLGRRAQAHELGWLNYGPQRVFLPFSNLPSGRYFGKLSAEAQSFVMPITLVR